MASKYYDMEEPVELPRWFKVTVGLILGIGLPLGIFAMVAAGRASRPNDLYDARRIDAKYPAAATQKPGEFEAPRSRPTEITVTSQNDAERTEAGAASPAKTGVESTDLTPQTQPIAPVDTSPNDAYVQPPPGGMEKPGQFDRLGSPPSQGILHGSAGTGGGF